MKLRSLVACFILLVMPSTWAGVTDVNQTMIQNVLETFTRDCSFANGPSAEAIDLVKSLSQTLSAINDPNCNSALGAVAALERARVEAEGYLAGIPSDLVGNVDQTSRSLQRKKEEIVALMSQTSNPAEMNFLKQELISTQLQLAQSTSERNSRDQIEASYRRARSLRALVVGTNAAIDQMLNNRQCWLKKPGILQNVAGVGSAIGYSVAMSSPNTEIGFLISAGLQIVSRTIDFFITLAREDNVDLFQVSIQPVAMACTLQKMNRIYCDSQDTVRAVDTIGPNLHNPGTDPIWSGVKILGQEMPQAISWMDKLRSGGTPNSQADARLRLEFQQKETLLDNSNLILEGVFDEMGEVLSSMTRPADKFKTLKDMLINTVKPLCPSSSDSYQSSSTVINPLCEIYENNPAIYFLLGLSESQVTLLLEKNSTLVPSGLTLGMLAKVEFEPSYELGPIRSRFKDWQERAKQKFMIVRNRVIGTDMQLVFDEGISGSRLAEEKNRTPLGAFRRIYTFLEKTTKDKADKTGTIQGTDRAAAGDESDQSGSANELDLRKNVLESLKVIIDTLEKVSKQEIQLEPARLKIVEAANLTRGSSFLRSRIDRLVRRQLQILVEDRNYIPNDVTLRLLAATDYISVLQNLYGNSSLAEIKGKALTAQAVIQNSLPGFLTLFRDPIKESLKLLSQSQDQFHDTSQASKYLKTSLCFYLLQSPKWNDKLNMESCLGLQEISPIGIETPKFSKALFSKAYEERACIYNTYIRRNRIYESREHLPNPALQKSLAPVDHRTLKKALLSPILGI